MNKWWVQFSLFIQKYSWICAQSITYCWLLIPHCYYYYLVAKHALTLSSGKIWTSCSSEVVELSDIQWLFKVDTTLLGLSRKLRCGTNHQLRLLKWKKFAKRCSRKLKKISRSGIIITRIKIFKVNRTLFFTIKICMKRNYLILIGFTIDFTISRLPLPPTISEKFWQFLSRRNLDWNRKSSCRRTDPCWRCQRRIMIHNLWLLQIRKLILKLNTAISLYLRFS